MSTALPLETAIEGKAVVLYDGECPLCKKSVSILKKLDWLNKLTFQNGRDVERLPASKVPLDPQRLIEEMHLLTPDRLHAYPGYKAFRYMAWRLPLTMLFAPFMYVPGVPWIGNKIYLWIAKNRLKLVPCDDGGCKVHFPKKPAK